MQNIYRVVNEEHLIEILERNLFRIVMVSFGTKQLGGHIFKKYLVDMAKKYPNSIFLYVDLDQYETQRKINLITVPTTIIYFNKNQCGQIPKMNFDDVTKIFCHIEQQSRHVTINYYQKIDQIENECEKPLKTQQIEPKNITSVIDKLEVMKKTKEDDEKNK